MADPAMNQHAAEPSRPRGGATPDGAIAQHEAIARLTDDVRRLQSELIDLRILDRQRQASFADVAEQRDQARRKHASLRDELTALRSSPVWRVLGPFHALAARRPWFARQLLRVARTVWWTLTLQVHRRFPQMLRERRAALAETALQRATPREPIPASAPAPIEMPLVASVLKERFWALQPFPTYRAPGLQPRITLVTDSINSGSLYGGVATAIIFAVELAKASGGPLRVLTRTELPHQDNVRHVLENAGIAYRESIEFCCSSPGSRREVDIGEREVFLTTSWWTTDACRKVVAPERIIYLLQEDEREFYPAGDDRLRCAEILKDPRIRFVTNTRLLADHLASEGYDNIGRNGLWFDPAFPSTSYYYEPSDVAKRNFFFYARPGNLRNLFYRGIEVIGEAVEQRILDAAQWQIHFVGKDLDPAWAELPFRPVLKQNLAWADYTALVRRMDLGLSLMYTPHPSYPPLDLVASGSVVVTNRHGLKQELDHFSKNIICADSDAASLVEALRTGAALARDGERRLANYRNSTFSRDWSASFRDVVATLSKQLCS
jgi:hypothetical protein